MGPSFVYFSFSFYFILQSSLNPDASAFTPTFQNSAMGIEELEFDLGSSSEDVRILEITTSKMFFLSHDQRARARKPPVIKFVNRSDINQDPQTLKQYKEEDNIALPSPHSYDEKKDINVYSYENTVVIREPTNSRHGRIEGNFSTNTDVSVVNLDNKENDQKHINRLKEKKALWRLITSLLHGSLEH